MRGQAAYTIYALIDPRDDRIRYVGCALDSAMRLQHHIRDASSRHSPVHKWIWDVLTAGARPTLKTLEVVYDALEAAEAEVCWIRRMQAAGHDLTNSHVQKYPALRPRSNWSDTVNRVRDEADPKIAERLRFARNLSGLTARELSRLAGMAEGHVALIESGKRINLEMRTALSLCSVLGLSLDWLILGDGDAPTECAVQAAAARSQLVKAS